MKISNLTKEDVKFLRELKQVAANKHHYRNPVDYLNYAFRNPELEKVLEILSKIEIEGE